MVSLKVWTYAGETNFEFQIPINVDQKIDLIEVLSEKLTQITLDPQTWVFYGVSLDYKLKQGQIYIKKFSNVGNEVFMKFVKLKNKNIFLNYNFVLNTIVDSLNPEITNYGLIYDVKLFKFKVKDV